jgi:hypothetical protein
MTFEYLRTTDGSFQCPHCDFTKKNQSTVHMHIKAKHMGAFKHKCEHCNYETSAKQTLDNHIAAKHPEHAGEKKKEFVCPESCCGFESMTKAGLRSHYLLKHLPAETAKFQGKTEAGNIQCTHCGTQFNSKPSFIYHLVNCLPADLLSADNVKKGLCV